MSLCYWWPQMLMSQSSLALLPTISLTLFLHLSLSHSLSSSVTLASFAKASKFIAHFLSATWACMRHVCVLSVCVCWVCVLCVYITFNYMQFLANHCLPLQTSIEDSRLSLDKRAAVASSESCATFSTFSTAFPSHFNLSFIYAKGKLSGDTLAPSTTTTITNCPAVEWNYNN